MTIKFNLLWACLLAILLPLGLIGCNDDDDINVNEDKTLVEIAVEDDRFTTLVSALQRTGLDAVLADEDAEFTVFAPTNDAFNALGVDLNTLSDEQLRNILLYHVIGGNIASTAIPQGKTYINTAATVGPGGNALTAYIERDGNIVEINNAATVTAVDINGENGVLHVIDAVLMPLDIVGHAAANDDFAELVNALGAASGDLISTLSRSDQIFTVFAPVNSAFEAISDEAANLTPDQLASVLTYHVVAGANVRSSDLTDGQSVTTVQGETFIVNIGDNGVSITDANGNVATVVLADVQATNGVIHVIDEVIMPSNL